MCFGDLVYEGYRPYRVYRIHQTNQRSVSDPPVLEHCMRYTVYRIIPGSTRMSSLTFGELRVGLTELGVHGPLIRRYSVYVIFPGSIADRTRRTHGPVVGEKHIQYTGSYTECIRTRPDFNKLIVLDEGPVVGEKTYTVYGICCLRIQSLTRISKNPMKFTEHRKTS